MTKLFVRTIVSARSSAALCLIARNVTSVRQQEFAARQHILACFRPVLFPADAAQLYLHTADFARVFAYGEC